MNVPLKDLGKSIDLFATELQKTHLAYRDDEVMAKCRAKELIDDIIKNGFIEHNGIGSRRNEVSNIMTFKESCEKFSVITIEYTTATHGGCLMWELE